MQLAKIRIAIAFAVAPLLPGLAAGLIADLSTRFEGFVWTPWYLGWSAMLGYPTAIVVGVPLFIWLKTHRKVHLAAFAVLGLLLGLVSYLLVFLWGAFSDPVDALAESIKDFRWGVACMVWGAFSTTAFWTIARPDKAASRRGQA
jgi:hypothetical protein